MSVRDFNSEKFIFELNTNSYDSYLKFEKRIKKQIKDYDIIKIKSKIEIEVRREVNPYTNNDVFP